MLFIYLFIKCTHSLPAGTDIGFVTFRWFFDVDHVQVFIETYEQLVDAFALAKYVTLS